MAGAVDELVQSINRIADKALPGACNVAARQELAEALGDFSAVILAVAASRAAEAQRRRAR